MARRTVRLPAPVPARPAAYRPAPGHALRTLLAVAVLLFGGMLAPATAVGATAPAVTAHAVQDAHPSAHPHVHTRSTPPRLAGTSGDDPHHSTHPAPGTPPPHRHEPRLRAGAWTPQLRAASADRLAYAGRCLDRAPPHSDR
ncbi:hypothetical protein AB0I10_08335 [Streptomyces sp. NPDC050636]|uniref:hypothetical protein n=1 Tax=Streptomyces sp. NPDC050636 TaxID=3154510 RepID=UPI0034273321